MSEAIHHLPLIREEAPAFEAETTQEHVKSPEDYRGKWVIFFSHPADFTPVCTTEFMTFASMQEDLRALNSELLGLSIDSIFSHIAWLRTIKEKIESRGIKDVEVTFPVIADLTMEVARKYGMLQPAASTTQAVRAVFLIDPNGKVRAILYYPLSAGRNMEEIKRLLIALQTSDAHAVACAGGDSGLDHGRRFHGRSRLANHLNSIGRRRKPQAFGGSMLSANCAGTCFWPASARPDAACERPWGRACRS